MSPLDAALVRRKLSAIARNLEDLAEIEALTLESNRADRFRMKATERLLQERIEAAVNATVHLLRSAGAAPPPDYFSSFLRLGELQMLPSDLAERLAPAAGLRNRLVHQYDEIDDGIVLTAVGKARRDFGSYAAAVERYVSAQV